MSDTVKLHVTDRQGNTHEIEATIDPPKDVIAKNLMLDHFGDCGGCCACATCLCMWMKHTQIS